MPNIIYRDDKRYFKCCLCDDIFEGFGNNPEPLMDNCPTDNEEDDNECCNDCNNQVIAARINDVRLRNLVGED